MTDLSLSLLRHGYGAVDRHRPDTKTPQAFSTRLLGRRCVVVTGERGARLFYDEELVERRGAVPPPLAWLLFGRGAVHGLDGEEHRARKRLFLDPLEPDQVRTCASEAGRHLEALFAESGGREVDVHDALVVCFGTAVLDWAGVDLAPSEAVQVSREYAAIVDGFGFAGRAYPRAWAARRRTDALMSARIADVRLGRRRVRRGTWMARVCAGDLADRVAAVELGNVLRPTIAVSWLGAHAAHELARPTADRLRRRVAEEPELRRSFAQEVRRTAPFVPALVGRVRGKAHLDGLDLRPGDRVLLDVRGIDFSPELYDHPETFLADRFLGREPGRYTFVPQGGGSVLGHRCPGESMALALLEETVRVLAGLDVGVTTPDPVDLRRIPTLPRGGPRVRAGAPIGV